MADTTTKFYKWIKPEPHASPTTWGDKLNADLDGIDAQINANQVAIASAGTLVGQIIMWPGGVPPTNWWWCSGDAVSRLQYPTLFGVISTTYGAGDGSTTFNLPNLFGRVPVGYDGNSWVMGAVGGEATHTLTEDELAAHIHNINDPGHIHAVGDAGHVHSIVQTPHTHGISDPSHVHGGVTTGLQSGANLPAGAGFALAGGATAPAVTGIGIQGAFANINNNATEAAVTGVNIGGAPTGITLASDGGNAAHNNMQPYIVIGYIIRLL